MKPELENTRSELAPTPAMTSHKMRHLERVEDLLRRPTLRKRAHCSPMLVVDDEPLIEMEAVDLFHDLGYEAIGARNADQAMLILRARDDVVLVFTDIEIPGTMNGLVLAAVIKATWPRIQVLVTSDRTTPPDEMLLGRARFLPKPYDARQIEQALALMASPGSLSP
ncbi:response regulator [Mesorhizobium sp. A556]